HREHAVQRPQRTELSRQQKKLLWRVTVSMQFSDHRGRTVPAAEKTALAGDQRADTVSGADRAQRTRGIKKKNRRNRFRFCCCADTD
ncbi:hypothetical protein CSH34_11700, partial [Streptococcus pneumoniae]